MEKIKALAGIELNEIQQRGIERLVHQETKKQKNIEDITAQAAINLTDDAKVEELEDDWISHFFDKCEKVSDVQMQSLWASLLSGEASKPGAYSKHTVGFVGSMDKKDAELFAKFCQFTWMIGGPTPLIFDPDDEIYTKNGISFSDLNHLSTIGLVLFEFTSGYLKQGLRKKAGVFYFGKQTVLKFSKETENTLDIGKALFTQAGKELVNICGAQRNNEFYDYCIEKLVKQGIKIK